MDKNNLGELYNSILLKEESLKRLNHKVMLTSFDIHHEKSTIALYKHVLANSEKYLAAKNISK